MFTTIELPEQQVEYLKWLLEIKLNEPVYAISNTDREIAKRILEKLNKK